MYETAQIENDCWVRWLLLLLVLSWGSLKRHSLLLSTEKNLLHICVYNVFSNAQTDGTRTLTVHTKLQWTERTTQHFLNSVGFYSLFIFLDSHVFISTCCWGGGGGREREGDSPNSPRGFSSVGSSFSQWAQNPGAVLTAADQWGRGVSVTDRIKLRVSDSDSHSAHTPPRHRTRNFTLHFPPDLDELD